MKAVFIVFLAAASFFAPGMPILCAQQGALKTAAYDEAGFLVDYAQKYGYFSAEGVAVEHSVSTGALRLLNAGRVDACISGMGGAADVFLRGIDIRVLAQLFPALNHYGVSRFSRADAVKIKAAAGGPASGEVAQRLKVMLKYLGAKDVKIAAGRLDDSAKYKLLEEGKTDLVLLDSLSLMRKVRAEGKYYIFEPSEAYKGEGFLTGVLSTRRAIAAKGPELEKFIAGLRAAFDDALVQPDRVVSVLTEVYGFTAPEALAYHGNIVRGAAEASFEPSQGPLDQVLTGVELPANERKKTDLSGILAPEYAIKAVKRRSSPVKK